MVEAADGGVFRSDDGGATWTLTNNERKLRQRTFYYTRIYADPLDRDTVYGLNTGFYKSTDGGVTFDTRIEVPHGDNHDLWIDPNNPLRMINTNDGGGNVSINGGETWTEQDFPTTQLYHVIATNDFPYHVCGAQQDNSTVCVPSSAMGSHAGARPGPRLVLRGGRRRERLDLAAPHRPGHLLRREPGSASDPLRPLERPDPGHPGLPAILLRRAGECPSRAVAVDVSHHVLAP